MKTRILSLLLAVSLLLNIAGLVFFICFLNLKGHYKTIAKERNQFAGTISQFRLATALNEALPGSLQKRQFVSHADGQANTFGLLAPSLSPPTSNLTLVVYLHGMGSNYLEPFFYPQNNPIVEEMVHRYPQLVFLSSDYHGEASWGNDLAVSDLNQNIREILEQFPIGRIVLVGTSMGGCTALTYLVNAPEDIKEKLIGVVCVEGAGDLAALYNESRHPAIQPAMSAAFGGTLQQKPLVYSRKSFLSKIDALSSVCRIAIVSAKQDDVVPPDLQRKIVDELNRRKLPVKLIEVDGGHGAPPANVYMEGLDFVLGKGN